MRLSPRAAVEQRLAPVHPLREGPRTHKRTPWVTYSFVPLASLLETASATGATDFEDHLHEQPVEATDTARRDPAALCALRSAASCQLGLRKEWKP